MTALTELLKRRIAQTGPMTVAEFMAECLLHPEHGYYSTRDPFGAEGDFTTAPEISQMFGELIGLALAQTWIDQSRPSPFVLAELGPGRGTLMSDILRATRAVPGFAEAAQVVLVEASKTLRRRQAKTLEGVGVDWADRIEDVPSGPLFVVANEFFDALPIRQFQRGQTGWQERVVGLTEDGLRFGLSPEAPVAALMHRLAETAPGELVELCSMAAPIMAEIARRIEASGGVALIIDYGDAPSRGDTLQAVQGHTFADPLEQCGAADLTAHVDFAALIRAAGDKLRHSGPLAQGVWLERLGITARAKALAQKLGGAELESHVAAHRRLTHPQEMGTLFKVLALSPQTAPPPPGFAE